MLRNDPLHRLSQSPWSNETHSQKNWVKHDSVELKLMQNNVWHAALPSGIKKSELNVLGTSKLIHDNFISSKIPENPPEYQKYYRQMNKVKQNQGHFYLPLKLKAAVKRLISTPSFCLSRAVSPLVHGTADGSWLTAPPRGWSQWCCYRSSAPPSASRWHQSDYTMLSVWWVCRAAEMFHLQRKIQVTCFQRVREWRHGCITYWWEIFKGF